MSPPRDLFALVEPTPVYTAQVVGGVLTEPHGAALAHADWPDRMTLCMGPVKVTFNNPRERCLFALGLGLALSGHGARRPE